MIAPRENGSLLAPTSWFPSTATMPKRGPQPLELLDHRPRRPRHGSRCRRSAPPGRARTRRRSRRAFRNARMLSDGVPACRSLRCRIVRARRARAGRPATPTVERRGIRPTATRRDPTPRRRPRRAVRAPKRSGLLATHGVELVAQATSRAGRSARAACSGGPRRPNGRCRTRRSARPVGPGTRLRRPLQRLRGGGRESSACGDSTRMRTHRPLPPQSSPALERGEQGLVGGL